MIDYNGSDRSHPGFNQQSRWKNWEYYVFPMSKLIETGKETDIVMGGFNIPVFAGNQPIAKQSGRTGLPVCDYREEEYLSESQKLKRIKNSLDKEEKGTQYIDFDDLRFHCLF